MTFHLFLAQERFETFDRDAKLKNLDTKVGDLKERILDEGEEGECRESDWDRQDLMLEINIGREGQDRNEGADDDPDEDECESKNSSYRTRPTSSARSRQLRGESLLLTSQHPLQLFLSLHLDSFDERL